MGDRHDYVALEWVKGEIAETLKQAHHAIETLLDDPQATHALSECLACIHQVHGSLQMVEFYGAALLAEEMEQLATGLAAEPRQPSRRSDPPVAASPRATADLPRPGARCPPRSAAGGVAAAQRPAQRPRRKPVVGNQPVQPAIAGLAAAGRRIPGAAGTGGFAECAAQVAADAANGVGRVAARTG